uniref:C3H1-type domain-containing protein n=1 Tax=Chromera velia CCMP2878 TaxID=1169474 RepID=A0A0G4IF25_9ALVE|mmetsp:Transcript_1196/g.2494  ORF Transcript_1196/g.2494 Transcript_1196/m.2494 type:complete len:347 (+) Transcript_1196:261-1301(+)|eukprot:Cvel_13916.t1-p1 / transcript=Cvel_13916.t1 / gene=Cvel_13916 / organism=Chromera_velia_CCMP2878 / gene_product=hypothetical protein / transcript_product=hypothetical protein / location=Cvel_scaffold970:25193-26788(-) / protein_length=346 / sequence_SO=supercontig / SO=protein_coding / is_pseudo=false
MADIIPPRDCKVDLQNTFISVTPFYEVDRKKEFRRRMATLPALPVSVAFNDKGVLEQVEEGETDVAESSEEMCKSPFVQHLANVGSLEHRHGRCQRKRCYWFHTNKGCRKGWLCTHCHYCKPLPMTKGKKNPRHLLLKPRREGAPHSPVFSCPDHDFTPGCLSPLPLPPAAAHSEYGGFSPLQKNQGFHMKQGVAMRSPSASPYVSASGAKTPVAIHQMHQYHGVSMCSTAPESRKSSMPNIQHTAAGAPLSPQSQQQYLQLPVQAPHPHGPSPGGPNGRGTGRWGHTHTHREGGSTRAQAGLTTVSACGEGSRRVGGEISMKRLLGLVAAKLEKGPEAGEETCRH